jgi:hypothetical protein
MMDCDSNSLHADMSLNDVNHKLIQGEEKGGLKHLHSSEPTTEGLLTIEETHSTSDNNTTAKDIAHLDVVEVLQRWTSALQQIHKQIVCLVWFFLRTTVVTTYCKTPNFSRKYQ